MPKSILAGTSIDFHLSKPATVTVNVFNILGQRVRSFHNVKTTPGKHTVQWNGEDEQGKPAPSGIYICRLAANGFAASKPKKMLLLR